MGKGGDVGVGFRVAKEKEIYSNQYHMKDLKTRERIRKRPMRENKTYGKN